MSQRLPVNNFEWIKDISQFDEDFIKNYNSFNSFKSRLFPIKKFR